MFRASSVPIIRSYLLHARQLVRFMQVMWPLPSRVSLEVQPDSAKKRSHNLHETYQLPCVQQITPDDGHRRCPKHVEFYDKINFGYLMHLVGFIRKASAFSSSTVATSWDGEIKVSSYNRTKLFFSLRSHMSCECVGMEAHIEDSTIFGTSHW
jgi:hypothetical protein